MYRSHVAVADAAGLLVLAWHCSWCALTPEDADWDLDLVKELLWQGPVRVADEVQENTSRTRLCKCQYTIVIRALLAAADMIGAFSSDRSHNAGHGDLHSSIAISLIPKINSGISG